MMTRTMRCALVLACAVGITACTQPAASDGPAAPSAPTPEAGAPDAGADPTPGTAVTHVAPGPSQQARACMIAGEFHLFGKTLRSRDCV